MGDYTGLKGTIYLKADTPRDVIHTLVWMAQGGDEHLTPPYVPDHELFRQDRAPWMLRGGSAYLEDFATASRLSFVGIEPELYVCFTLKNYEGEIEQLLDWLGPYTDFAAADLEYQFEYWLNSVDVTFADGVFTIHKGDAEHG